MWLICSQESICEHGDLTPLKLAFGQTRMSQTKDRTLEAGSCAWFHGVSPALGAASSFSLETASLGGAGRLELL